MLESLWVILSSTVFVVKGGLPLSTAFHFSPLHAMGTTSLGGILGVVIFTHLSQWILNRYQDFKKKRRKAQRRRFTWINKTIVRTKIRFGLLGISAITPLLLSLPLGCFLALRYFGNKQKVMAYMMVSVVFWSATWTLLQALINTVSPG
jgi:hypothetical protein